MSKFIDRNTVFVVQPASCSTPDQFESLKRMFERRGWRVINKPSLNKSHEYLAGSDKQRLRQLESAYNSGSEIVVCLRGGYGSQRLLPLVKKAFQGKPLVGFSDITALQVTGAVAESIHSGWSWLGNRTAWEIFTCICRKKPVCVTLPVATKRKISGKVIAANLSVLTDLLGTPFLRIPQDDFVLFIEDTNEPLYRIDRMLFQLLNSEYIKKCVGIAIGNFDYKRALYKQETIIGVLKGLNCSLPVVYFPFGHMGRNLTPIPQFWSVFFKGSEAYFEPNL